MRFQQKDKKMLNGLNVINTSHGGVLYGFGSITVKCYIQDDKLVCCISDGNRAFLPEREIRYEFNVNTPESVIEKTIYREIDLINLRYGNAEMVIHKLVHSIVENYNKFSVQSNSISNSWIAFDDIDIDYKIDWGSYEINGVIEYKKITTIKFNSIAELKTALENIQKWK